MRSTFLYITALEYKQWKLL